MIAPVHRTAIRASRRGVNAASLGARRHPRGEGHKACGQQQRAGTRRPRRRETVPEGRPV
ncbi:hypothetical protein DVDV_1680 [Desulfovibrio sp. DV]|nr:hypothetical protein DVDV_1680 [Desulfovibrio sp. DV]